MLNLYSIFVHYVLFFQKKLPPLPPIFQLMWGVLPSLPLSETAPGDMAIERYWHVDYTSFIHLEKMLKMKASGPKKNYEFALETLIFRIILSWQKFIKLQFSSFP